MPDQIGFLLNIFVRILWWFGEESLKLISGPLDGVLNGVWEVVKGTDGNCLLWGVLRRGIRFRDVR